jgi:hypothetical protein
MSNAMTLKGAGATGGSMHALMSDQSAANLVLTDAVELRITLLLGTTVIHAQADAPMSASICIDAGRAASYAMRPPARIALRAIMNAIFDPKL